MTKQQGSAVN